VIVHAGVAIDRLDPEEARETLRLFEEMLGERHGKPQMNTDEH
jgi:hydrogenase maturation factor